MLRSYTHHAHCKNDVLQKASFEKCREILKELKKTTDYQNLIELIIFENADFLLPNLADILCGSRGQLYLDLQKDERFKNSVELLLKDARTVDLIETAYRGRHRGRQYDTKSEYPESKRLLEKNPNLFELLETLLKRDKEDAALKLYRTYLRNCTDAVVIKLKVTGRKDLIAPWLKQRFPVKKVKTIFGAEKYEVRTEFIEAVFKANLTLEEEMECLEHVPIEALEETTAPSDEGLEILSRLDRILMMRHERQTAEDEKSLEEYQKRVKAERQERIRKIKRYKEVFFGRLQSTFNTFKSDQEPSDIDDRTGSQVLADLIKSKARIRKPALKPKKDQDMQELATIDVYSERSDSKSTDESSKAEEKEEVEQEQANTTNTTQEMLQSQDSNILINEFSKKIDPSNSNIIPMHLPLPNIPRPKISDYVKWMSPKAFKFYQEKQPLHLLD